MVRYAQDSMIILEYRTHISNTEQMWAKFYIDTQKYTLTIISSYDDFIIKFEPEDNKSFIEILCEVKTEKLLSHVSEKGQINNHNTYQPCPIIEDIFTNHIIPELEYAKKWYKK